jgi:hypothetical protein
MIKPITPKEAAAARTKACSFPKEVIEAFNEAIAEGFNRKGYVCFTQEYIVEKICEKLSVDSSVVFESYWLDVELLYEKAGWKVEYDKPGYNEPSFTFTPKDTKKHEIWL